MADDIDTDFTAIGIPRTPAAGHRSSPSTVPPAPPGGASSSTSASGPKPAVGLDRGSAPRPAPSGVVQPKPQALPKRTGPSSIIVSPRQKGNPVLSNIKSMPWEYGDIPADYVLGVTTCALFLSLKYHRLHPEYIYTRIRNLQGKYNLRIILVMVDIQNHEASLQELSKTSVINNVTLVLCWSAAEGGRYLELFKTYENAAPTSIKQHQSTNYSDRLVDFITTPRSINKTDAVALVSQFGSIRTAVNARHEDVAMIAGWGEKKVKQWCTSVREPFRIKRAAKRGLEGGDSSLVVSTQSAARWGSDSPRPVSSGRGTTPVRQSPAPERTRRLDTDPPPPRSGLAAEVPTDNPYEEDEAAMAEAMAAAPALPPKGGALAQEESPAKKRKTDADDSLSNGVMAALQKLRSQ